MNSHSRRHVSLGDAVGPPNTTSCDLINTDSAADDPLLLFATERSSFTPERLVGGEGVRAGAGAIAGARFEGVRVGVSAIVNARF